MGAEADSPLGSRAAVIEAAQSGAYDRYAAALLAPQPARDALIALAAFSAELARIAPSTQREPRMGEIRLQWWREALEGDAQATGHPVADALKEATREHGWPTQSLLDIVESHAHDGIADAFADDQELLATLSLGETMLFRLAARCFGWQPGEELDALAEHAGIAYGIARRLFALPLLMSHGHLPFPQSRLVAAGAEINALLAGEADTARGVIADLGTLARDHLAHSRHALRRTSRKNRIPFLPLALVDPYLEVAAQAGRNPLRDAADLSRLKRLVRIAAMHLLGRF